MSSKNSFDYDSDSDNSSEKSDDEMDWQLEILQNRYAILKELGSGSYATVWLAYDVSNERYNAIKISKRKMYNVAVKEGDVYDLLKQKCACDHLMTIIEHFDHKKEKESYHCIVMELMGFSCYEYIKKHMSFDINMIAKFINQTLIGLDALHSNKIIHGDIKPENILMTTQQKELTEFIEKLDIKKIIKGKTLPINMTKRDKILDQIEKVLEEIDPQLSSSFCSSESEKSYHLSEDETDSDLITLSSTRSQSSSFSHESIDAKDKEILENDCDFKIVDLGGCIQSMLENQKRKKQIQTCYYMAPEILLRLPYDESADMWAFGCTLYEIITGNILFDASEYKGNEDRYHLYLITQRLGVIPSDMIRDSPYKDILFTHDTNKIKGIKNIESNDLFVELNQSTFLKGLDTDVSTKIINLILGCLEIRPGKRITAEQVRGLQAQARKMHQGAL